MDRFVSEVATKAESAVIQWDDERKEGKDSVFCLNNVISMWQKLGNDPCPGTQEQSHLEVISWICILQLAREPPSVLCLGHSAVCGISKWKMARAY